MLVRNTARVLGVVIGLLAIVGFFVEGEHLGGVMNVDLPLDVLRLILAVALLVVGFARVTLAATRAIVVITGVLYLVMALAALIDPDLFGMLPTGLTAFDIAFHFIVGIAALVLALLPSRVRTHDATAAHARVE